MTGKQIKETLEQQRSRHAWRCCEDCKAEYINLAKGLPALITNSGLLQVLCFLQSKGENERRLSCHLREWLHIRFPQQFPDQQFPEKNFKPFLESLMGAEPRIFQAITHEAFEWLRWVRQMAPARRSDSTNSEGRKP